MMPGVEEKPLEPRDRHGQPVSCASVWVPNAAEPNGGHWSPDCPHLRETYSGMDGERYRFQREGCGYSYFLDYEEMR